MRIIATLILFVFLTGCGGINKILKNQDAAYKLRMAEKYFVKKKFNYAQQLYEDIMPYYVNERESFENIYYKYAYCAYYQLDYLNAENLFKTVVERFPNSTRAEEMEYMRAYAFYKQSPKAELDQTNTLRTIGMMQTFISTHPGSARSKEAGEIIDICRQKLEIKEYKSAQLYFDIGQFRAAGVSFANLSNNFPESARSDEYKIMVIKSYFRFAELSIEEKKVERFESVIKECNDFIDRFPESKLKSEAERYISLSQNNIKILNNEPSKTPA